MTRRTRRGSRVVFGTLVLICLGALVAPSTSGSAATAPTPIKGQGSWGVYRELLTWQNDLATAKAPIDLGMTTNGSWLGRQAFLAGTADFVMSGVPFSAAELAKLKGGAGDVIDAPIQVSSLAFLLQRPVPEGFQTLEILCDPDDPEVTDPDACVVKHPYSAPVRVPNANIAAMMFKYAGTGALPMSSWNSPDVLAAMGVQNFTTPPLAGPAPVLRSDQDELNFYLQQFASRAAPAVWAGIKASDSHIAWDPITERLPRQAGASRSGAEQQAQQLAFGGGDPATGVISGFTAGVFAGAPASAIGSVRQTFPQAQIEFMQMQNANGDWVAPTPASITLGAAAGGETPLYALSNKIPGAYPLVWIEHLYAPAHGLSLEKTEALAAVIRYIATAGQGAAEPVGEGRLPDPLVKKSLAAADVLVHSNCTGKVVESTDPGPYLPDLPAIKTIGTMAHCTSEAVDTTAPPASTSNPDSSTFDSSFTDTGTTGDSTNLAVADVGVSARSSSAEKRRAAAILAATKLPLPFPASTSGIDRLATLLLGAGLYFLLRKPVRKLLSKGAS